MNDEPRPARCFYLTIHFGTRNTNRCQAPVGWWGVIRTADGATYRVLSCDVHADHLEDRRALPKCIDAADSTTDRVIMFSWNR